jgi:hypothetical protein
MWISPVGRHGRGTVLTNSPNPQHAAVDEVEGKKAEICAAINALALSGRRRLLFMGSLFGIVVDSTVGAIRGAARDGLNTGLEVTKTKIAGLVKNKGIVAQLGGSILGDLAVSVQCLGS